MTKRNILVIGASAGGLLPLKTILSWLPPDLQTTLFVVLHLPSQTPGRLPDILSFGGPFQAKWAEDEESVKSQNLYVAPPGRHLIVNKGKLRVMFGPRESLARPAIDVLFRSAAAAYGSRVVGIVLSGKLYDGARGLDAVKRCGGTAIVMDPELADEPDMPRAAIQETRVDHVLSPEAIGLLIPKLTLETADPIAVPQDILWENRIAQEAMLPSEAPVGDETESLACPECGGNLKRIDQGEGTGYRCRVGHAYGVPSLLNAQQDQVEQAMWVAMRTLADRKRFLRQLADDYEKKNQPDLAESMLQKIQEIDQEYQVLRNVLVRLSDSDSPPIT